MIDIKTTLTEEQYEALRDLYVFHKEGVPPSPVMDSLHQLGLAGKYQHKEHVIYVRTEMGIGYVRSLGWKWGFWQDPHLPSPPPQGV